MACFVLDEGAQRGFAMNMKPFSICVAVVVSTWTLGMTACGSQGGDGGGLGSPCSPWGPYCLGELSCSHAKKPPCAGRVECDDFLERFRGVCYLPAKLGESCATAGDCEWRYTCGVDNACVEPPAASTPQPTQQTPSCSRPTTDARCPDGYTCRCRYAVGPAIECSCVVAEPPLDAGSQDAGLD